MVGIFLAALDQTVVGTALPRHHHRPARATTLYTWAFTAYLLTSTISGPIYGKLSDLYGRRPIFLLGIGIFLVGSVLAGLLPVDRVAHRRPAASRASAPAPCSPSRWRSSATSSRRQSGASTRACSAPSSASRSSSGRPSAASSPTPSAGRGSSSSTCPSARSSLFLVCALPAVVPPRRRQAAHRLRRRGAVRGGARAHPRRA